MDSASSSELLDDVEATELEELEALQAVIVRFLQLSVRKEAVFLEVNLALKTCLWRWEEGMCFGR